MRISVSVTESTHSDKKMFVLGRQLCWARTSRAECQLICIPRALCQSYRGYHLRLADRYFIFPRDFDFDMLSVRGHLAEDSLAFRFPELITFSRI